MPDSHTPDAAIAPDCPCPTPFKAVGYCPDCPYRPVNQGLTPTRPDKPKTTLR